MSPLQSPFFVNVPIARIVAIGGLLSAAIVAAVVAANVGSVSQPGGAAALLVLFGGIAVLAILACLLLMVLLFVTLARGQVRLAVPPGLGLVADALDRAATTIGATAAPLHEGGRGLTTAGATVRDFQVPWVNGATTPFWDALRQALLQTTPYDIGATPPENFPTLYVLSSFQLDADWRPFDSDQGLGAIILDRGIELDGLGSRATEVQRDLHAAAAALRQMGA